MAAVRPGWLGQPELPTVGELLSEQDGCEALPPNPVTRVWPSKEAHLGALYEILRCEGTEGLRSSVTSFKGDPSILDDKNICVYTDVSAIPDPLSLDFHNSDSTLQVRVKGYLMTRVGPVCRIEFNTRRAGRKIKWQQSRRLTPGSAVALTAANDNFRTVCKVATVAQRPYAGGLDQDPPEVDIQWADINDAVFNPCEELIMVESRNGYWESVRHVLVGLQQALNIR